MAEQKLSTIGKITALVTALAGTATSATIFSDEVKALFSWVPTTQQIEEVKQHHDDDMRVIGEYARGAYSNTLPPRIRTLLVYRCKTPHLFGSGDLPDLLARLLKQYEELNGRQYVIGTCENGIYCNSLGVCEEQDG